MTKEQKDKILKALAEDRNDYARDCQARIEKEYGKIAGADYMLQRFLDILKTEYEFSDKRIVNEAVQEAINDIKQNYIEKDVLDKIRAEIAEYGSIMVAYAITKDTKTDKGIEKLVSDVLSEAKRQVLDIIDKYKESESKK